MTSSGYVRHPPPVIRGGLPAPYESPDTNKTLLEHAGDLLARATLRDRSRVSNINAGIQATRKAMRGAHRRGTLRPGHRSSGQLQEAVEQGGWAWSRSLCNDDNSHGSDAANGGQTVEAGDQLERQAKTFKRRGSGMAV